MTPSSFKPNWLQRLEAAGIVFAMAYAIVTGLQWWDLRQNFKIDQRAWVKVRYQFLPDQLDPKKPLDRWLVVGVNAGKSVATGVHMKTQFEIVPSSASPSYSFIKQHGEGDISPLFPGDDSGFVPAFLESTKTAPRALRADEIDDLTKGLSYLAVFGIVTYKDQFGPHWTRFCFWKSFATQGNFNADSCVEWNTVGDGKPPN